jgi:hypothetical protein
MGVNMRIEDLVKLLINEYNCLVNPYEEDYIELWCGEVLELPRELEGMLKRIGARIDAGCAGACSGFGELFRVEKGDKVIYYTGVYFDSDYLWVTIKIPKNPCNCSECPIKDLCSLPSPIYCPYFNCTVSL